MAEYTCAWSDKYSEAFKIKYIQDKIYRYNRLSQEISYEKTDIPKTRLIKTGCQGKLIFTKREKPGSENIVLSCHAVRRRTQRMIGICCLLKRGACRAYQAISDISLNLLTYLSMISTTAPACVSVRPRPYSIPVHGQMCT